MSEIKDPNSSFDFNKLLLNKPTQVSGNYFIKYSFYGQPLYIQPPKSVIKQMIMNKSAKKSRITSGNFSGISIFRVSMDFYFMLFNIKIYITTYFNLKFNFKF